MRIAIDVDQVLCDTNKDFLDYFNKKHNANLCESKASDYYYGWVKEYGFEPRFVFDELIDYLENNLDKYVLIDDAKEVISKLREDYKLYILTSRGERLKERTILWLNKLFGENFFEEILFIDHGLEKHPCKSDVCKRYRFDLLIEDHPEHAVNSSNIGTRVLLYSWPWNRDVEESSNLKKVKSWDEIYERIIKF